MATRGYLHKGTPVSVRISTNDNEMCMLPGIVQWCSYFDKQVHCVEILPIDQIDPRLFVSNDTWVQLPADTDDTEWMKRRTALVIEDSQLEFNVLSMLLANANITVQQADSLGAAIDRVQKKPFDIIILSDSLESGTRTEDAIQKLQTHGYVGPIIVYTSSKNNRDHSLKDAGAAAVLQSPLQLGSLLAELRDAFEASRDPMSGTAVIYSTLSATQCPDNQLAEYLKMVAQYAQRLDTCIKSDDSTLASKLCSSLHSTGAGYGYPMLSSVASSVVQSLHASCSAKESSTEIRKLIRIIGRLQTRENEEKMVA